MLCHIRPCQQGRWAGTTESPIDDILVPLVGKIWRGVVLFLGGIIIRPTTGISRFSFSGFVSRSLVNSGRRGSISLFRRRPSMRPVMTNGR